MVTIWISSVPPPICSSFASRAIISTTLHAAYKIAGITPDMLQPAKK